MAIDTSSHRLQPCLVTSAQARCGDRFTPCTSIKLRDQHLKPTGCCTSTVPRRKRTKLFSKSRERSHAVNGAPPRPSTSALTAEPPKRGGRCCQGRSAPSQIQTCGGGLHGSRVSTRRPLRDASGAPAGGGVTRGPREPPWSRLGGPSAHPPHLPPYQGRWSEQEACPPCGCGAPRSSQAFSGWSRAELSPRAGGLCGARGSVHHRAHPPPRRLGQGRPAPK